jgi:hypothetical protein
VLENRGKYRGELIEGGRKCGGMRYDYMTLVDIALGLSMIESAVGNLLTLILFSIQKG